MMRGMRALLGICAFVIAGLVALSTFSSGPPTSTALHSLVTQTHHQLNQLHKLREELGGDQPLDNSVLNDLGFVDNPILFPNHSWTNISTPVIVSAVTARQTRFVPELIRVAQILSVNSSLVIYALDLTEDQVREVDNECNETCVLIQFDFSQYPAHVRDSRLGAYRPIIIQEMLQRASVVFWLDPCMQILENASLNWLSAERSPLEYWMKKSQKSGGVLAWPLASPAPHLPTAALTHPDMFPAFRTYKRNYDFQQMSDPRATLIVNTPIIHRRLLRPWVSCALTPSCLSPIGAQDTGCKYNKKPLFRYSGCHLYDASAFNVALGLAFGMDNASYLEPTATFICVTSSSSYSRWHAPNTVVESSPSLAVAGLASPSLTAYRSVRRWRRRHLSLDTRSGKVIPSSGKTAAGSSSAGIEQEGLAGSHFSRTSGTTTSSPVRRKGAAILLSPTTPKGVIGEHPVNNTAIYSHVTRPNSFSQRVRTRRR